jgi:hypothetical protein
MSRDVHKFASLFKPLHCDSNFLKLGSIVATGDHGLAKAMTMCPMSHDDHQAGKL